MARAQYDLVHAHRSYDLEIDTSTCTPREAAVLSNHRLENGARWTAWEQLRRCRRVAGGEEQ